jgi:uncharacterized protein YjbJ (UPF0337 family)
VNREWREGLRRQLRGALDQCWGALVRDPRRTAAGARERLAGRIQARHGAAQHAARRQLREFQARNRNWFDLSS